MLRQSLKVSSPSREKKGRLFTTARAGTGRVERVSGNTDPRAKLHPTGCTLWPVALKWASPYSSVRRVCKPVRVSASPPSSSLTFDMHNNRWVNIILEVTDSWTTVLLRHTVILETKQFYALNKHATTFRLTGNNLRQTIALPTYCKRKSTRTRTKPNQNFWHSVQ